jgi:hypothetical protein
MTKRFLKYVVTNPTPVPPWGQRPPENGTYQTIEMQKQILPWENWTSEDLSYQTIKIPGESNPLVFTWNYDNEDGLILCRLADPNRLRGVAKRIKDPDDPVKRRACLEACRNELLEKLEQDRIDEQNEQGAFKDD